MERHEVFSFFSSRPGTHQRGAHQLVARCPAHEDDRASLSVYWDGATLRMHCFAGCRFAEVAAAIGLETGRGRPNERQTHYVYTDTDGRPLYRVVRTSKKEFYQERFENGRFVKGLGKTRRVPYHLMQLGMSDREEWVLIVEGEKDVERAETLGLTATCNSGGAGKWLPSFSQYFEGRRVCVIPDNDEPGRLHAEQVAGLLVPVAKELKIVTLPDLPPKGDLSDWCDAGGGREALLRLIETPRRTRKRLTC